MANGLIYFESLSMVKVYNSVNSVLTWFCELTMQPQLLLLVGDIHQHCFVQRAGIDDIDSC